MTRPIRHLLILLIVAVLMAASPAWAAAPICCDPAAGSALELQPAGHATIPTQSPCAGLMPGCASMIGCSACLGLRAVVAASESSVERTRAAYWSIPASLEGLPVEPALDPPIAI